MKLITFTISTICLIFYSFITIAQDTFSIEGKVISGVNKKFLNEALVQAKGSHQLITLTNESGLFRIDSLKKGKYVIEVVYGAYDRFDTTIFINDSSIKNLTIALNTQCKFNRECALKDIKNSEVKLFLLSVSIPRGKEIKSLFLNGSVSLSLVDVKTDTVFEKKYDLRYYYFSSCEIFIDECVDEYNQTIFAYLEEKNGKNWLYTVHKDVIALKEYMTKWIEK